MCQISLTAAVVACRFVFRVAVISIGDARYWAIRSVYPSAFGVNATSTIVLTATASASPGVNNTSAFLSVPGDHASANNLSLAPTTVLTNHDLAISNEIAPQPAVANDPLTMTMTITNLGPSAAVNPQIVSSLPAELLITSIAPSQGACSLAQNIITCRPGSLLRNR